MIIGGTPLTGGSGTVIGALIGTLIIASIQSGIIFFGIQATWSTFVTGAVIIVAVTIDQIVRRQRSRRTGRRALKATVRASRGMRQKPCRLGRRGRSRQGNGKERSSA